MFLLCLILSLFVPNGNTQNSTCPELPAVVNGEIVKCTTGNSYGSICYLKCDVGFALQGSRCRRCQSTGTWSGYKTVCVLENTCQRKLPTKKTTKLTHPIPFQKACCPQDPNGKAYNALTHDCCFAGRLRWRVPLQRHVADYCGCCHSLKTKCWSCCETPSIEDEANELKAEQVKKDKEIHSLKIVGGGQASNDLRKRNVYLTYERDMYGDSPIQGLPPVCGGVLIHRQWALTARHCFSQSVCEKRLMESRNIVAIIGKFYNDAEDEDDGVKMFVEEVVCHPHYCNNRRKPDINDLALVKFETEVDPLKDDVIIASLPLQNQVVDDWTQCTLTGYGITKAMTFFPFPHKEKWLEEYMDLTPQTLQEVSVPVIPSHICSGQIRPCHLCAGSYLKDGCSSDSGSPLFCPQVGDRYVLHGIYSAGFCGKRRMSPGVYARVSYYVDWINDVIKGRD